MPIADGANILNDTVVVTVRKSFWASRECGIFPNRIYTKIFFGYSQNLVNSLYVFLRGLLYCLVRRPRLVFFGSATRIVPWFARLKKWGLLREVKLIATGQLCLSDRLARYCDRIIIHWRSEMNGHDPALHEKYVFMPIPADGDFEQARSASSKQYIFSGGGAGRDFTSLIEAVRGLNVELKIVTFSPEKLGYSGKLPENCSVYWRMPLESFLGLMGEALFVVVPLVKGQWSHGHTTVAQALCLGKAVITTRDASVEDYIADGEEGLLVPPGDVAACRAAVMKLLEDHKLRGACEDKARIRAQDLTYARFAQRITALCEEVLS